MNAADLQQQSSIDVHFRPLVLAVWFTHCSSTGIRRVVPRKALPNLSCPRNGKWTNLAFRFHHGH